MNSNPSLTPCPMPMQSPFKIGLAEPIRLILNRYHEDSVIALGDALILPARTIHGVRSVAVLLDRPFPSTARCDDPAVTKAGRAIVRDHDIHAAEP